MAETEELKVCRILSLDGGGAKGFYTLGVLKGIEGMVGPLHQRFDLIYGTSTGSIIAALVALGHPVDEILELYKTHVVEVMKYWLPGNKTAALKLWPRMCSRTRLHGDKDQRRHRVDSMGVRDAHDFQNIRRPNAR